MSFSYYKTESGDLVCGLFRIPADGKFAMCFEIDPNLPIPGTLHKHGPADSVIAWHRMTWNQFQRAALTATSDENKAFFRKMSAGMRYLELPVKDMNAAIIEEINACIATSGRISTFEERLPGLAAAA